MQLVRENNMEHKSNYWILYLPLLMVLFSFYALMKSYDSGTVWKIVFSIIALIVFLTLSVLSFKSISAKKKMVVKVYEKILSINIFIANAYPRNISNGIV